MCCYIVRHGQDDETIRGGWSQHSLTAEGRFQAQRLAEYISCNRDDLAIRHIYSSDLRRAAQTAEPIAAALDLPVIPMAAFREVNNGELAGMKNDLAQERFPGLFWNRMDWEQRYPGGESPRAFYERIKMAWDSFQKEISRKGENVLLVTHGGVINVLRHLIQHEPYSNQNRPYPMKNGEMIVLKLDDGQWTEIDRE